MASFKTLDGAAPIPIPPSAPEAPRANRRVLVVEDDDDSRELLAEVLRLAGHSVMTASDGEDALAAVLVGDLDVVVTDVTLPGLDGTEVARRARKALGKSSHGFFATSGHALDSHDARDWPFDAYFVKPLDLDSLVGAVASFPKPPRP